MTWTVAAVEPRELAAIALPSSWPPLSAGAWDLHAPDLTLLARDGATVGARCSLWWRDTPPHDGVRVGAIGHYAASDDRAAAHLLDEACRVLSQHCRLAVGPMDGNTWQKYRFVTEWGTEPPFFMEPTNPDLWPTQFAQAGFGTLAHYFSALNTDLSVRDQRLPELQARFAERGVTLRAIRMDDFETELRRIYAIAEHAFTDNVLYTPISFEQFAVQYRAGAAFVVPELVLIAEQDRIPVGFSFSVPDLLERQRGEKTRTVILKTVAALPDRSRFNGLGSLMIDATHEAARTLGFTRVVHALMHESNQSLRISARTATVMRRYALFAKPLAAATG
jgi:hypothetical protein